jgi:hypothetical protein
MERLELGWENFRLARHWLSLWRNDEPPSRSEFNPAHAKEFLPGLALFEINSDGDINCRLTGTAVDSALGFSLSGKNFLSFVAQQERHIRQKRLAAINRGSVAVARTAYVSHTGEKNILENLHLPFSGATESGARQFVIHTNLRPTHYEMLYRPEKWNAGFPDEFDCCSFI